MTRIGPVVALFVLIIGGLYLGAFTATEAAGIGASGAFLFAVWRRTLTWAQLLDCAIETAGGSAALLAILIGALLFSAFMNFGGLPRALQGFVTGFGVEPLLVITVICVLYIVLGTFFEELSMILLTVPIFFPLVTGLGYDRCGSASSSSWWSSWPDQPAGRQAFVRGAVALEYPDGHAVPLDRALRRRRHRAPGPDRSLPDHLAADPAPGELIPGRLAGPMRAGLRSSYLARTHDRRPR